MNKVLKPSSRARGYYIFFRWVVTQYWPEFYAVAKKVWIFSKFSKSFTCSELCLAASIKIQCTQCSAKGTFLKHPIYHFLHRKLAIHIPTNQFHILQSYFVSYRDITKNCIQLVIFQQIVYFIPNIRQKWRFLNFQLIYITLWFKSSK